MTVSLADLPKGHEVAETRFKLTPEWVTKYVGAVEDDVIGAMSGRSYPPLALAACSVRALLEQAALPEGAIHVGQELNFSLVSGSDSELVARARIASRGERQGWVLMGIDLSVETDSGKEMMSGRATITFPVSGGAAA
jgi:hypothetical protein